MKYIKHCETCGREFETSFPDRKNCSKECDFRVIYKQVGNR